MGKPEESIQTPEEPEKPYSPPVSMPEPISAIIDTNLNKVDSTSLCSVSSKSSSSSSSSASSSSLSSSSKSESEITQIENPKTSPDQSNSSPVKNADADLVKRSRLASIELIKAAEEAEKDLADAVSEVNKSIREDDELDQEIENAVSSDLKTSGTLGRLMTNEPITSEQLFQQS